MGTIGKKELAKRLSVSTRTIGRWIKHEGLPVQLEVIRPHHVRLLFDEAAIMAWLNQRKVKKG